MSAPLDMQTRGAGIGGPIVKLRFMSFPRALNSLKPLNSAPLPPLVLQSSGPVVRVLVAPPISRRTAEISRGGPKYPRIGAFPPVRLGLWILAHRLDGRYGRSVSAPRNHFSQETETDLT
jgi:hypothetical protein